jgi:hypothetical protein
VAWLEASKCEHPINVLNLAIYLRDKMLPNDRLGFETERIKQLVPQAVARLSGAQVPKQLEALMRYFIAAGVCHSVLLYLPFVAFLWNAHGCRNEGENQGARALHKGCRAGLGLIAVEVRRTRCTRAPQWCLQVGDLGRLTGQPSRNGSIDL